MSHGLIMGVRKSTGTLTTMSVIQPPTRSQLAGMDRSTLGHTLMGAAMKTAQPQST